VAGGASGLALAWTPPIYYVAAAVIDATAAVIAGRCARGMGMSAPGASLVGAAVLVLPAAGWEVPLLLTNVDWYVLAASVVFVGAYLVGYTPPVGAVVPLLVVAGLTSPLLVIALPVLSFVTFRRRRRFDVAALATCATVTAIQLTTRALSSAVPGSGGWSPYEIVREYAVRVVIGGAVGARFVPTPSSYPPTWFSWGFRGSKRRTSVRPTRLKPRPEAKRQVSQPQAAG
jgi:hypothetical protein